MNNGLSEENRVDAPGYLYVVATPIGNLDDITVRAMKVLKQVDLIAAEDTRRSRKLLAHLDIPTRLTSYHNFNKEDKTALIIDKMLTGMNVALVTDAGTPTVSDPGFYLLREASKHHINIVAVPGPSAVIAALSVSALASDAFTFVGFLPRKINKRKTAIADLGSENRTFVLYESPQRLIRTLQEIKEVLGDRDVVVARELTKLHEEVIRAKLSEMIETFGKRPAIKGEITLVVGKADKKRNKKHV